MVHRARRRTLSHALLTLALLTGPHAGYASPHVEAPPLLLTPSATRVVAAGRRYEAGALHRFIFGEGYRSLWAAPWGSGWLR